MGVLIILVELQGLEPWTSSMPWKHSSQLSYSPLIPDDCNKDSPLFLGASLLGCYAPTRGAMFVLKLFVLTLNGTPLAYQLMFNYALIYQKSKYFSAFASIVIINMIK